MGSLKAFNSKYPRIFRARDAEDAEDVKETSDLFRKVGYVVMLDAATDNDYSKWPQFEKYNIVEFLNLITYILVKKEEQDLKDEMRRAMNKG